MLNENSEFNVFGRISDGSFHVSGDARSTSGTISLFGADFDIDRAEFELDTANIDKPASLTARARTTVYDDSSGVETEIFLNVNSIDRESGKRTQASALVEPGKNNLPDVSRIRTIDLGALGILEIEFKSTNPADDTQEKILAKLGISPENIRGAVTGAFTSGVDNYYFNLWMRPIEIWLRRKTRLDVVRFTPSVLGNIVRQQLGFTDRYSPDSDFMLFDRSRVMLGEYFYEDWFLSYRGQYGVGRDFLRRKERGFFHEIGLQYLLL